MSHHDGSAVRRLDARPTADVPAEDLLAAEGAVLARIASGESCDRVLHAIVRAAETLLRGARVELRTDGVDVGGTEGWAVRVVGSHGRVHGALVARTAEVRPAAPGERRALEALARCAAIAMDFAATQEALRRERELLTDGEQLAGLGSWSWQLGDDGVHTSEGTFRLGGFPPGPERVTLEQALSRIHHDDQPSVRAAVRRVAEVGGVCDVRYRLVRAGGEVRIVRARLRRVSDAEGRPLRVVGASQDVTEQEAANAALRESERRYRLLFERTPLPLILYSVDTLAILDVNEAAVVQYGWTREELCAMTLRDIRPPEDQHVLDEAVASAVAKGGSAEHRSRHRHRRKDGSTFWADVLSHALPVPGQHARLVLVKDVTAQVAAEEALRESEARFRAFVEQATDTMFLCDATGKFEYVSPAITALLGYAPETMVGHSLLEYLHPDDVDATLSSLARLVRGEDVDRIEVRARHARGTWRFVEAVASVLDLGSRRAAQVLVSLRDSGERRRADEALRASEERFRTLSASSPLGIFMTDGGGQVTYVNPRAAQMWELTEAEALGVGWTRRVHPDDVAGLLEAWGDAVARGEDFQCEYRIRLDDGRIRWVHGWSAVLRDASGAIVGSVGTVDDVTERRDLEQELRQAQKMDAVGRLAGGIAHDFNNLLTVIKSHAEFLLESVPASEAAHDDVQEIGRAAARAAALTRQLLAFSRKQLLRPQPLDLHAVLNGIEPMLHRLIGEDVTVRVAPSLSPAIVRADPGQVEQVIVNLAVNARDAMPSGGTLTISAEAAEVELPLAHDHGVVPAGRYVLLRVRDTGTGMPEPIRQRVFEPFFTTKAPGKGTGLGLSTVYGIVRQSGGHVTLESTPGAGTTFTVYLPEVTADPAAASVLATAPARGSGTVLLVEDEDQVRALARRILERRGYTVLAARDGREALALEAEHVGPIDLLLTDVVMPGMNGRELAEALTARRPEMHVVYMSGYTDDVIVHRSALSPRLVLVHKPFTAADLVGAVGRALEG